MTAPDEPGEPEEVAPVTLGNGRAFLDTNVIVYAHDSASRAKQRQAQELLLNADLDLVLSAQVLGEFYVVVTRKLETPMAAPEARQVVAQLAELAVVPINRNTVLAAMDLVAEHQLSYWDALIVQTASDAGADYLLSEDMSDGATLAGVQLVNPFRMAG